MDGYVAGAAAGDDSADVLETQNDQFVSVERAQSGPALLAVVRSPGAPPPPVSSVLDQGEGLQRAGEHGSVAGSGSRPVYPHGLSGALASSSVQHTSYGERLRIHRSQIRVQNSPALRKGDRRRTFLQIRLAFGIKVKRSLPNRHHSSWYATREMRTPVRRSDEHQMMLLWSMRSTGA